MTHRNDVIRYRLAEKSILKSKSSKSNGGNGVVTDGPLDCSNVCDVVGCLVVCDDFQCMRDVIERINEQVPKETDVAVYQIKSRWEGESESGWRDVICMLGIKHGLSTVVCEVQIVLDTMVVARKGLKGHEAYGTFRSFYEMLAFEGLLRNSSTLPSEGCVLNYWRGDATDGFERDDNVDRDDDCANANTITIKRMVPTPAARPPAEIARWQWKDDSGWKDFLPASQLRIADAESNGFVTAGIEAGGRTYVVDLNLKVQYQQLDQLRQRSIRKVTTPGVGVVVKPAEPPPSLAEWTLLAEVEANTANGTGRLRIDALERQRQEIKEAAATALAVERQLADDARIAAEFCRAEQQMIVNEVVADAGRSAAVSAPVAVQRSQSIEAADEVASFPLLIEWTVDHVVTFICNVNSKFLALYEDSFRKERILGSYLTISTKEDLVKDLGIKKLHAGQSCECTNYNPPVFIPFESRLHQCAAAPLHSQDCPPSYCSIFSPYAVFIVENSTATLYSVSTLTSWCQQVQMP